MEGIVFLIPIIALLSIASVFLAHSPIGKALAARASGSAKEPDQALQQAFEEQAARLLMAEDEIEKLRERVDFNERLIASRPSSESAGTPVLPAGDE